MTLLMQSSDFVDYFTILDNHKLNFGSLYLSNILKNQLISQYSVGIKDIELAKDFIFNKNGFKVLTRNYKNVDLDIQNYEHIIVGSYVVKGSEIILFLKLIEISTGNIVASSMYSFKGEVDLDESSSYIYDLW